MCDVRRVLVGTLFTGLGVYRQVFVSVIDSMYVIEPFGQELHSTCYVSRVAVMLAKYYSKSIADEIAAIGSIGDVEAALEGKLSCSLLCADSKLVGLDGRSCLIRIEPALNL